MCFHSHLLANMCCCISFSKCDFLPGLLMDTITVIPSHHMLVTYRRVNARWRVAAGCDMSRSPPPSPCSLCINILQLLQGRVHIYLVSCMVLPKPVSSGWSGIKGSATGTHWGTHTHTCTNTAKSLYQRRRRDGVWIKLANVGRSAKHTHARTQCVRVCVVGVSGHYLNRHFPEEWDSDCSIFLKSDDATFHFSTF